MPEITMLDNPCLRRRISRQHRSKITLSDLHSDLNMRKQNSVQELPTPSFVLSSVAPKGTPLHVSREGSHRPWPSGCEVELQPYNEEGFTKV